MANFKKVLHVTDTVFEAIQTILKIGGCYPEQQELIKKAFTSVNPKDTVELKTNGVTPVTLKEAEVSIVIRAYTLPNSNEVTASLLGLTQEKLANQQAEAQRQLAEEVTGQKISKQVNELQQVKTLKQYATVLRNKKPLFRKTYSTLSSLAPQIEVSIVYKFLDDNTQELNLFNVPYNHIKSLKLESNSGAPQDSTLILTLEEPTGNVASVLLAFMYLRGAGDTSNSTVPKLYCSFGWGGLQSLAFQKKGVNETNNTYGTTSKKTQTGSTLKQQYIIESADLSYEGVKQKLEIKCKPDVKSQDYNDNLPFKVFGESVTKYICKTRAWKIMKGDARANGVASSLFGLDLTKRNEIVNPNTQYQNSFKILEKNNTYLTSTKFLTAFSLSNVDYLCVNFTNNETVEKYLGEKLTREVHPYVVFCYVLNNYLRVKSAGKKKIFVLPLFNEDNLVNGELVFFKGGGYTNLDSWNPKDPLPENYVSPFVYNAFPLQSNKESPNLTTETSKVGENEDWETVLKRFASYVKYKYNKEVLQLSASVVHFGDNEVERKQNLTTLKEFITKVTDGTKGETKGTALFEAVENSKADYFVVLTPEGFNYSETNYPVQSYTVFPKVKPEVKPNRTFFNSGSKRLVDASFPDVIEFKPKLNLANAVYSSFNLKTYTKLVDGGTTKEFYYTNESTLKGEAELTKNFEELSKALVSDKDFSITVTNTDTGQFIYNGLTACSVSLKGLPVGTLNFTKKSAKYKQTVDNKTVEKTFLASNVVNDIDRSFRTANKYELGALADSLFFKSLNVSLGETSSSSYASFVNKSTQFFKKIKEASFTADAELKILGEPQFSNLLLIKNTINIFLQVNNEDGSENTLLTGGWRVVGFLHEIDEGKFTTTLKLKYDNPYLEDYY